MDIYNLVSFAGVFVLVGFAWVLSADKKNMNWRVIIWGIRLSFNYPCCLNVLYERLDFIG